MMPHLGAGFPLICFQRLSDPNIATLRCRGCDSRQTRGSFNSVLSSHHSPITRSVDYIFILRPNKFQDDGDVGVLPARICHRLQLRQLSDDAQVHSPAESL